MGLKKSINQFESIWIYSNLINPIPQRLFYFVVFPFLLTLVTPMLSKILAYKTERLPVLFPLKINFSHQDNVKFWQFSYTIRLHSPV